MVASAGGTMMYKEGKKLKRTEAFPVKQPDRLIDVERGVAFRHILGEKVRSRIDNGEAQI